MSSLIRLFVQHDLARLTESTVETFRPFYEDHFRPLVGEVVFANQHGNWRGDCCEQVAGLHDPGLNKYVAVAEIEDAVAGYAAWSVEPARGNGTVTHLAVSAEHRRHHVGTALCEHAFGEMWALGAEAVELGTGGDPTPSTHPPELSTRSSGALCSRSSSTTGGPDRILSGTARSRPVPGEGARRSGSVPEAASGVGRTHLIMMGVSFAAPNDDSDPGRSTDGTLSAPGGAPCGGRP
ncbi:hypothetical protein GCM10010466_28440 [Planomonospora alba]|uniref:N-acetyltransferase domain-containing protein n=1 Tax=Planomonospora alba TaxID=161354 RepID=A0ABP6N485_9ACTN